MICVFGRTGQVAQELQLLLPDAVFLDRADADLTDAPACATKIAALRPSVVINAAAYTNVDQSETDEDVALLVNATAPAAMADACAALNIPFVHISTDYVFNGTGTTAFSTNSPTDPINAYGRTKLAGETAILKSKATFAILRTSWVFSAHGNNFVKTMLRLSKTHEALNVVSDQIGGPTSARAIATACVTIAAQLRADQSKTGTYHFAGTPDTSWAGFATEIFKQAGRSTKVTGIPAVDYPTPASRPANSRLDCADLKQVFGIERPDWKTDLSDVLTQMEIDQ